ncbi:trehalose-phosphatase [Acuticoccus sp. M5D2P5]|uniref:trehalose-phosphatase n=1 Tax=Acuticoccus kalidii TaxID=2910977 RepID=UPI001F1FD0A9|nr:trehalose-phosphatase [Acuticoccus kalidii]MCF3932228.1 trehalose-phosphatase [Acuticoccus kalidii]
MTPPVPDHPALFLDFDGTLVEIAERPDGIVVASDLPEILMRLVDALGGAVAVVSGRQVAQIDQYLSVPVPVAGMHGLERRLKPGEAVEAAPPPAEMETLRERLQASPLIGNGVKLEDKGAGLAVHYRAAPDRRDEVLATMNALIADLPALQLIDGKMVVEAKGKGFDKGAAVDFFMERAPFAGRTPIFIGDDTTDEDGIRAAAAIGGFGIKVGDGPSAAQYRLSTVTAVHHWLDTVAEQAS